VIHVVYEDNHLIAVAKPHGVLVQADDTGDSTILDEVKLYLKEKYHKPGNVFLGVIHRLDRPVAGILLLAKTSKGASRVSEQFRAHTMKKVYHAVVEGEPKESSALLVHHLRKDTQKNIVYAMNTPTHETQEARLTYTVVQSVGKYSLVQVELHTGRPHQIRTQLSFIGHPIVGDVKYGASTAFVKGAIALMATDLEFTTATTEERISLHLDVPPEFTRFLQ
jgi:23S rRNA pseudouridine1911/1915/1917 synthase